MPRLFSGIEIPSTVAQRLAGLRAGLANARWVEPENYHITLRFIGDVDEVTAEEFASTLRFVRSPAFDLALTGLGSFGNRKPRAVWAGVAQNDALMALQRAHERAAQGAGLAPEGRKFHPHVTLARLRGGKAPAVAAWLEEQGGFFCPPFEVSRFVLFSSRASSGGGAYIVEQDYPLSGR
ncbi:MAG: RNA 2',3'-cyclic phosphodiesterase [Hyphomicrobiales bacterium]|nr:RNA 2',3'-cyclic phosphodiesterase [Hyphomicrobiales bacterium]